MQLRVSILELHESGRVRLKLKNVTLHFMTFSSICDGRKIVWEGKFLKKYSTKLYP